MLGTLRSGHESRPEAPNNTETRENERHNDTQPHVQPTVFDQSGSVWEMDSACTHLDSLKYNSGAEPSRRLSCATQ